MIQLNDKQKARVNRVSGRIAVRLNTERMRLRCLLEKVPMESAEYTIITNAVNDIATAIDYLKTAESRTKQ